jgi:hypothetical protein
VFHARLVAAITPWLIFAILTSNNSSTQAPNQELDAGQTLFASASVIALFVSPLLTANAFLRGVERRLVPARAMRAILRTLDGDTHSGILDGDIRVIAEPLGRRRASLGDTAKLLTETADYLDTRQPAIAPHPIATLLRGSAARVRNFLLADGRFSRAD